MKTNYQKVLDATIDALDLNTKVPTLLLHSCCAPCSSYVLEYLSNYFAITIYYYNSNISPSEEFNKRALEQIRLINALKTKYPVKYIIAHYDNQEFENEIKGLETEKEGGSRCFKCYRLRLENTCKYAKAHHFDYFTTTLSISPYKNSDKINEIGISLEQDYHINYLCADFKKKEGYKRSIELSRKYNLYRQNYCGCIYSKRSQVKVSE